jgi:hypothetical protein
LRLWGNAFEIHTIPCWQGGSEDAGVSSQTGFGIPTNTKAITVDWAAGIEAKAGVIRLCEDGVRWFGDELAEGNRRGAFVDLEEISRIDGRSE